jgi:uncharacterized protein (TIGR03083 family)
MTPEGNADHELVARLTEVWASMAELGSSLSEAQWKTATEVPGWSVQDNLVHITGLESMLLGRPDADHVLPGGLEHVKNDIGQRNEVFVDSRRSQSGADALAEFREVTGARLADLRGYGPDDFASESWTPIGDATVRDLLPFRIFDSWVHEQDMRRAVNVPGDLDSPTAALSLERMVSTMPFIVGKRAGAPDGTAVVIDLDGPLARTFAIGVEGGRAKTLSAVPADGVTTRIATDSETFARLACGRVDPAVALTDGRVRLEGDDALGRRVVEEMNFLF